jgi:hypothetical protein
MSLKDGAVGRKDSWVVITTEWGLVRLILLSATFFKITSVTGSPNPNCA